MYEFLWGSSILLTLAFILAAFIDRYSVPPRILKWKSILFAPLQHSLWGTAPPSGKGLQKGITRLELPGARSPPTLTSWISLSPRPNVLVSLQNPNGVHQSHLGGHVWMLGERGLCPFFSFWNYQEKAADLETLMVAFLITK